MPKRSKVKWFLLGCLTALLVLVAGSVFIPGSLVSTIEFAGNNDFTYKLKGLSKGEVTREDTLVEMVIERIGVSTLTSSPVVVLKEMYGKTRLPVWIGAAEANAISVIIEGVEVPRPLTPDLLCSILNRTGASVAYININELRGSTYHATIVIHSNWRRLEIDARPSDAIAIALRVGAPIYAEKSVLDEAGVIPDRETGKATVMRVKNDVTARIR